MENLAKVELDTFIILCQSSKAPFKDPTMLISITGITTRTLSISITFLVCRIVASSLRPYGPDLMKDITVSIVVWIKEASLVRTSWSIRSLIRVVGSILKTSKLYLYWATIFYENKII